jgi:hypothetical protein
VNKEVDETSAMSPEVKAKGYSVKWYSQLVGDQLMHPDELKGRRCRKEKKRNGEVAEK